MTPQVLFCKADFQAVSLQSAPVHGVFAPQAQGFAFRFAELHEVPLYSLLQSIQVPLSHCTTTWPTKHSSQFCITYKLTAGALRPIIQVIYDDVAPHWNPAINPWGTLLMTGLQLDFMPLIPTL